jgi:hypothetical protein
MKPSKEILIPFNTLVKTFPETMATLITKIKHLNLKITALSTKTMTWLMKKSKMTVKRTRCFV